MQFEVFHISLAEKANLFAAKNNNGSGFERESWIRYVFSQRIDFIHRGGEYHYIPAQTSHSEGPALIFGRIGRKVKSDENAPPEQNLEDVSRESWKASIVIIDPRKHDDGQKLAMQVRNGVGTPFSVLSSLMEHVSNLIDAVYIFDIRPLTDPSGFWDFVNDNKGEITSITLEFIAPNMFGIGDDMDKEWDSLKANEHAVRLTTQIENEHGLNPNTDRIERAVDYAAKGGGSVSARTKRGKRYHSRNRKMKYTIKEKMNGKKIGIFDIIGDAIEKIFGR